MRCLEKVFLEQIQQEKTNELMIYIYIFIPVYRIPQFEEKKVGTENKTRKNIFQLNYTPQNGVIGLLC